MFFFFALISITDICTLSLHDALPIYFWQLTRSTYAQVGGTALYGTNPDSSLRTKVGGIDFRLTWRPPAEAQVDAAHLDRKSTRLNSSHITISYAVFCLKKKKI